MQRFGWMGLLALALTLAPAAQAATIDFRSGGPITFTDGAGVTVTVSAWGGADDPQTLINPNNPAASGLQNLGTNVGGSGFFGTLGVGCGGAQCDLILPGGEDALLFGFNQAVNIGGIIGAAIEDPDNITVWAWVPGVGNQFWTQVGGDSCSTFSFCGGEEPLAGAINNVNWILVVAEDSGASAFRVAEFTNVLGLPEPTLAVLLLAGLALGARIRRA